MTKRTLQILDGDLVVKVLLAYKLHENVDAPLDVGQVILPSGDRRVLLQRARLSIQIQTTDVADNTDEFCTDLNNWLF